MHELRQHSCRRAPVILRHQPRKVRLSILSLLMLALFMSGAKPPTEKQKPKEIECRGNIVCLAEEMHTHYNVELFKTHEHLYGVKTEDGTYYTFLRTSLAEALFVDKRLHEKDLVIKGRVFPQNTIAGDNPFFPLSRMALYMSSTTTATHATSAPLPQEIAIVVRHRLC